MQSRGLRSAVFKIFAINAISAKKDKTSIGFLQNLTASPDKILSNIAKKTLEKLSK